MPKVKAKVNVYIRGQFHGAGEVFEYSGPANRCLEPYVDEQPAPVADERTAPPRKWWNPMTWLGSGKMA